MLVAVTDLFSFEGKISKCVPLPMGHFSLYSTYYCSNRMLHEEAENHAQISVIVNEGDVNKDHLQRFDCFLFCFVFGLFFYFIEPF